MATRLTVVMIETPPPTAGASRLAEDVVGHVIGRPGIDLTLVRSLTSTDAGSTDRLTLDSITGDLAVLDWQEPAATIRDLKSIGFPGHRAPHQWDSSASPVPPASRRIYLFNLNQFEDAGQVLQELDQLKSKRAVRTFSIGSAQPLPSAATPASPTPPTVPASQLSPAKAANEVSVNVPQIDQSQRGQVADRRESSDIKLGEIDLDDLIDPIGSVPIPNFR